MKSQIEFSRYFLLSHTKCRRPLNLRTSRFLQCVSVRNEIKRARRLARTKTMHPKVESKKWEKSGKKKTRLLSHPASWRAVSVMFTLSERITRHKPSFRACTLTYGAHMLEFSFADQSSIAIAKRTLLLNFVSRAKIDLNVKVRWKMQGVLQHLALRVTRLFFLNCFFFNEMSKK